MILSKKQMSEEDIKLQYITPAITSKWNIQKITMETKITDGRVNINTAGAEELMTLPGVGEAKAADIIAYREANGGFSSPEDIMQVSGIKDAMFQKIRDKIKI